MAYSQYICIIARLVAVYWEEHGQMHNEIGSGEGAGCEKLLIAHWHTVKSKAETGNVLNRKWHTDTAFTSE